VIPLRQTDDERGCIITQTDGCSLFHSQAAETVYSCIGPAESPKNQGKKREVKRKRTYGLSPPGEVDQIAFSLINNLSQLYSRTSLEKRLSNGSSYTPRA
jgi:hypothetical protein